MVGSSRCDTPLTEGTQIMGAPAVMSANNAVQVWRGTTQLTSGATYTAGETLTVKLQSPFAELIFQTVGGTFSGTGIGCEGTRSYDTTASLVMPATSTPVSVIAGYTDQEGAVSITQPFTLVGGAATAGAATQPISASLVAAVDSKGSTTNRNDQVNP